MEEIKKRMCEHENSLKKHLNKIIIIVIYFTAEKIYVQLVKWSFIIGIFLINTILVMDLGAFVLFLEALASLDPGMSQTLSVSQSLTL